MTSPTRTSREAYHAAVAFDVKELEKAFDKEEEMLEQLRLPDITTEETTGRQQRLKMSRQTRTAVKKLHRKFSHCPNRVLTEIFRASGSPAQYIKAAKLIRCDGCEHEKPKPQEHIAEDIQFNQSIGIDIFEIKDSNGKRYSVLSFLCLGTLYHHAAIVSTKGGQVSSKLCFQMFNDKWTQYMGLPEEVITDRGLHNRGDFVRGLTAPGVQFRTIGVESREQWGRTGRHGAILKGIIHRVIHELKASGDDMVKMILAEVLYTKNSQSRVRGFTPMQWVFGNPPGDTTSMTNDGMDLGALQNAQDESHEFGKQMSIRESARRVFIKEKLEKSSPNSRGI